MCVRLSESIHGAKFTFTCQVTQNSIKLELFPAPIQAKLPTVQHRVTEEDVCVYLPILYTHARTFSGTFRDEMGPCHSVP